MSTTMMSFDPTLHGTVAVTTGTTTPTGITATVTTATGTTTIGTTTPTAAAGGSKGGPLTTFEGFLKKAGHLVGVVLSDIVRFVIPVAQVVAVADPAAAPLIEAFITSLKLVEAAVLSAQQRWAGEGSAANAQKLADVLVTVEQPVILLFAQAGVAVDTAYVINLVNGVVAILNAQPAALLSAAK